MNIPNNINFGGSRVMLARYDSHGNLEWEVQTELAGGQEGVNALAIANEGKIVVAGWRREDRRFGLLVARYTPDGVLDSTFGQDGIVITDFRNTPAIEGDAGANAIAITSNDRIVVGGWATTADSSGNRFLLARYRSDGRLDDGFGSGGIVITDFTTSTDEFVTDVAVAPDGKIVAAGWAKRETKPDEFKWHFALARYESDGDPDLNFHENGRVITLFGKSVEEGANAVAIRDNKIVVAGWGVIKEGSSYDHHCQFMLVRYNWDGTRDDTFGSDGIVLTDFTSSIAEWINDIYVTESTKKIVAVGSALYGSRDGSLDDTHRFAVARYNWDGSPDNTFHGNGRVVSSFPGEEAWANAVTDTLHGAILVAGSAYDQGHYKFAFARYTWGGLPDHTFGSHGKLLSDLLAAEEWAGAIVISYNDGFLVAGAAGDYSSLPVRTDIIDLQVPWDMASIPTTPWSTYCRWDQFMTMGGWKANGHGVGLWGGVDYYIGVNRPVRAAQAGYARVRHSYIEITNDITGIQTRYLHVDLCGEYEREVVAGEEIGTVNSTSGHLMFEVLKEMDGQWWHVDSRDVRLNGSSAVPPPFSERLRERRYELWGQFPGNH